MTDNVNQERDTLAAFAGLVVLFVILAIVLGATMPSFTNAATDPTEEVVVAAATDEATEEVSAATEEPTEEPAATDEAPVATEEAPVATEEPTETTDVVSTAYDPEMVAHGEQLFITCSACHGMDGRGIPGLGKDLIAGDFATTATDDEIALVITMGRPVWDAANTTGIDMPPRGGNPVLSSEDIDALVAYIRSLQDIGAAGEETSTIDTDVSATDDTDTSTSDTTETTDTVSAYDPEMVTHGEQLFITCSACHGMDGRGIPGLGKDLIAGDFATTATDDEIALVITMGRPVWDAANTTGIDMPPRGGNPILSSEDIDALVVYIRHLQALNE